MKDNKFKIKIIFIFHLLGLNGADSAEANQPPIKRWPKVMPRLMVVELFAPLACRAHNWWAWWAAHSLRKQGGNANQQRIPFHFILFLIWLPCSLRSLPLCAVLQSHLFISFRQLNFNLLSSDFIELEKKENK